MLRSDVERGQEQLAHNAIEDTRLKRPFSESRGPRKRANKKFSFPPGCQHNGRYPTHLYICLPRM